MHRLVLQTFLLLLAASVSLVACTQCLENNFMVIHIPQSDEIELDGTLFNSSNVADILQQPHRQPQNLEDASSNRVLLVRGYPLESASQIVGSAKVEEICSRLDHSPEFMHCRGTLVDFATLNEPNKDHKVPIPGCRGAFGYEETIVELEEDVLLTELSVTGGTGDFVGARGQMDERYEIVPLLSRVVPLAVRNISLA